MCSASERTCFSKATSEVLAEQIADFGEAAMSPLGRRAVFANDEDAGFLSKGQTSWNMILIGLLVLGFDFGAANIWRVLASSTAVCSINDNLPIFYDFAFCNGVYFSYQ